MSWQNEMVRLVRYLVNDLDNTSYTYDDTRLEETIVVSAQLLQTIVDYYYTTYQVDIESLTINPDPTTVNNNVKEDGFINLVSLQAALIILQGEMKAASLSSVKIIDGPSTIDYTDVLKNKKILYDDMKDKFNKAVYQYRAGNSIAGHAVLTPYTYNYLAGVYNPN